jgi:hypothetical protein
LCFCALSCSMAVVTIWSLSLGQGAIAARSSAGKLRWP